MACNSQFLALVHVGVNARRSVFTALNNRLKVLCRTALEMSRVCI